MYLGINLNGWYKRIVINFSFSTMVLFFAGDFAPRLRVNDVISSGNFGLLFNEMLPIIKSADFAISNLESPLIDEGVPIKKTGPNLRSPHKSIEALKFAGFNMVTLANNHMMDYGKEGLVSTIKICNNYGIQTIGAGVDLNEAKQIKYVKIDNKIVSFINCCENEWSTTHGCAPGCNPLDEVGLFYQIQEAKSNSDYSILIIHGGHEAYEYPSPRMKKLYRWFVDIGIDAVIGHHTHCFSGYELYKEKPIVYSLGNFLFDGPVRATSWNVGAVALLSIEESHSHLDLIPYSQCGEAVGISLFSKSEEESWRTIAMNKSLIIADDSALQRKFDDYTKNNERNILDAIEPFSSHLIHAAIHKGLLPSLITKKKIRSLLNRVRCEAHRDCLINILNQNI